MKSTPTIPVPVADLDALPARGGSYIRQPDGSLQRALTASQPPAPETPIDPMPVAGTKE